MQNNYMIKNLTLRYEGEVDDTLKEKAEDFTNKRIWVRVCLIHEHELVWPLKMNPFELSYKI